MDFKLHRRERQRDAATQALAGYKPAFLVDATGETLRTARGSFALELLRHGFAEWAGMRRKLVVQPPALSQWADESFAASLKQAMQQQEGYAETPVVVCSRMDVVGTAIASEEATALLIVGQPRPTAGDGHAGLSGSGYSLALPPNVDQSCVAWLGASRSALARQGYLPPALAFDQRSLGVDTIQHILAWFRVRSYEERMNCRTVVVIHLDGLQAGRCSDDLIADEVAAACIGWAQRDPLESCIVLASSERVSITVQREIGMIAKHLGQTLQVPR